MGNQEIYDNLKALQNRAFSLSNNDKKLIRSLSKEFDIEFVERENCKHCFANQINFLMDAVKVHFDVIENLNCDYVVIDNMDVTIMGKRVNNNTITNELAHFLINNFRHHQKYIRLK